MNKQKIGWRYFLICAVVFSFSIVGGWLTTADLGSIKTALNNAIPFAGQLQYLSPAAIFLLIFINNILKSFFVILLGMFLGFLPLYSLYVNGYLIGILGSYLGRAISLKLFLASVVPHGVIEIIALIMASSYGLWLGVKLIRRIIYKEPFGPNLKYALAVYLRRVVPLLLFAAIIEAFFTPLVISWVK